MRVEMVSGVFLTIAILLTINGTSGMPALVSRDLANELVWEAILYGYVIDPDAPSYLSRGDVIFDVSADVDSLIARSPNSEMAIEFEYSDSEHTASENLATSMSVEGSYGAFSAAASMEVSTSSDSSIKTVRMDSVIKAILYEVSSKGGLRTFPEDYLTDNFKRAVRELTVEQIEDNVGVFYAKKMDLGGEIRKSYTMQATAEDNELSVSTELTAAYGGSMLGVSATASVGVSSRESNSEAQMKVDWSAKGGNTLVWLQKDFGSSDDTSVADIQAEWAATITDDNLYPFNYELGLMWDLVKKVDEAKGAAFQEYLEAKWEANGNLFVPTQFLDSAPQQLNIEAFRVKISDRSYAATSGKLRIGVRQTSQSVNCETIRETFIAPQTNRQYIVSDQNKFGSCRNALFLLSDPIEIRVLSDSGNDSYIDEAGVKINGEWKNWVGYQVKINNNGEGNSWRLVN